jgi:hypothetical protein
MTEFTVFNVSDMDTKSNKDLLRELFLLWENKNNLTEIEKEKISSILSSFSSTTHKPDSIVQTILDNFVQRAKKGKLKYGVDLDREDLSTLEWIQHAQEEHMDAILYLEKLKQDQLKLK